MHPRETILISLLLFVTTVSSVSSPTVDEILRKPHVLPAAEKAYHAVYHELDGSSQGAFYGQIYVALLEDQFTFGGDFDYWPNNKYHNGNKKCKSFMGTNVHHLCNDDYFLVHQDMVQLARVQIRNNFKSLDTICPQSNTKGLDKIDKKNLIYRYKNRVPMMFKEGNTYEKCIGTYDTETDTFTCMRNPDYNNRQNVVTDKKLEPLEISGFLWNSDGTLKRGGGHAEVFCKKLHYAL